MAYFADLSPHTYTRGVEPGVLNVGWLDSQFPYVSGETSEAFAGSLAALCQRPIILHRGFHICQFCQGHDLAGQHSSRDEYCGNGQIRVLSSCGMWYSAPTLIHHYVVNHRYRPPEDFINTVLNPVAVGAS